MFSGVAKAVVVAEAMVVVVGVAEVVVAVGVAEVVVSVGVAEVQADASQLLIIINKIKYIVDFNYYV